MTPGHYPAGIRHRSDPMNKEIKFEHVSLIVYSYSSRGRCGDRKNKKESGTFSPFHFSFLSAGINVRLRSEQHNVSTTTQLILCIKDLIMFGITAPVLVLCSVLTSALCCDWLSHYNDLRNSSLVLIDSMVSTDMDGRITSGGLDVNEIYSGNLKAFLKTILDLSKLFVTSAQNDNFLKLQCRNAKSYQVFLV